MREVGYQTLIDQERNQGRVFPDGFPVSKSHKSARRSGTVPRPLGPGLRPSGD